MICEPYPFTLPLIAQMSRRRTACKVDHIVWRLPHNVLLYARPEREQEVRSPPLPLSCSVMYFANAAAVSTINVTKPHMYQPNIKVMFNRVNQH